MDATPSRVSRAIARRREQPTPDAMTIGEHLGELRRRLIISVLAFLVAACIAAFFYGFELSVLRHPYCQMAPGASCRFYVTGTLDQLGLRVKLAAFGGLLLASPVLLFETWRFITPGLRAREKRYAFPFVTATVALFVLGCAIVYVVLPHTLDWLLTIGGPSIHVLLSPTSYFTMVLWLMVIFGLAFEFPAVLVALELARVVSPSTLLRHWRWAVIGITVSAALFTPSSDPFSMCALAVPLIAFYFGAIGVGKLLGR